MLLISSRLTSVPFLYLFSKMSTYKPLTHNNLVSIKQRKQCKNTYFRIRSFYVFVRQCNCMGITFCEKSETVKSDVLNFCINPMDLQNFKLGIVYQFGWCDIIVNLFIIPFHKRFMQITSYTEELQLHFSEKHTY